MIYEFNSIFISYRNGYIKPVYFNGLYCPILGYIVYWNSLIVPFGDISQDSSANC